MDARRAVSADVAKHANDHEFDMKQGLRGDEERKMTSTARLRQLRPAMISRATTMARASGIGRRTLIWSKFMG
jgi:hypothetical protein